MIRSARAPRSAALVTNPGEGSGVPEEYVGVGIRIEDEVVVTAEGHEVLTAGLPVSADEIERLAGGQG